MVPAPIITLFILVEIHCMPILFFLPWLWLVPLSVYAQKNSSDTSKSKTDSLLLLFQLEEQQVAESEAVLMHEHEKNSNQSVNNTSPLYAERDVFHQIAAFQFGIFRFRLRGYENNFTTTLINGLVFNQPEDGNPAWSLWSGIQQVMRNTVAYMPLRFQENWMSSPGNSVHTDMRALVQRSRLHLLYGFANRSYTNRYELGYTSAENKRGLRFSFLAAYRFAEEGFKMASGYQSLGYYLAADKRIRHNQVLSLIVFGNRQVFGKQAAITMPVAHLFGRRYNPNWGYQNGIKRNAAVTSLHRPVIIVTHEWQPNNHSAWKTSMGIVTGYKSDTGLDWFQAADPRPDYYRYLPAFQTDSLLGEQVRLSLTEHRVLQQIDWQKIYQINRNSFDHIIDADGIAGNIISGKRARYLLEERVVQTRRILFSSNYQVRINAYWQLAAGIHFRFQQNHFYKQVKDLLGADFHVNHNQFAESDLPADKSIIQFNLEKPDQLVFKGSKYGYDYQFFQANTDIWMQSERKGKRIDFLSGIHFSKQTFYRKGMVKNGLFPDHSKGSATTDHFFNISFKTALTFKPVFFQSVILFLSAGSRAPLSDNVYISPRMRNTKQENIDTEKFISTELMYRLVLPAIQFRISLYYTGIYDAMNVLTFYHDGYRNFVNYSISNIDQQHAGIESGFSFSFNENWQINGAASAGYYRYTSRQKVTVSSDNNEFLLDKMEVYAKNFRIAGSPQVAIGSGIQYRTSNALFLQLNWNYVDKRWMNFNPVRRTYQSLEGIQPGTAAWHKVIAQTMLPSATTVNIFMGKGFSVPIKKNQKPFRFFCTLSIQNLLNQADIITGGYEQLRFDQETKNVEKFPPKLFFANGINYAISVTMSL